MSSPAPSLNPSMASGLMLALLGAIAFSGKAIIVKLAYRYGVDGITLLREWSTGIADGCPVVMMSGHGTVDTAVEATRLGAFDFVEKPLSLATLLRTVERALESGRERLVMSRRVSVMMAAPAGKSLAMQQARADLARAAFESCARTLGVRTRRV